MASAADRTAARDTVVRPARFASRSLFPVFPRTVSSVSAYEINETAQSITETQTTVAGANTLIPVVYGTQRVGGIVSAIGVFNGHLIVRVIWCLGEIDAVVSVAVDDQALPAGIAATHYTGTADQTVDVTLAAAITGYADALPGVAYSVFDIAPGTTSGFPRFAAVVRGMKVRSADGGAKAYQDNPAYHLADAIESTIYGLGKSVDWASVAAVAARNDEVIGGERRRILGLTLAEQLSGEQLLQALRDYAGCFVVPDGERYRLVADAPADAVKAFDETNIVAGSVRLEKRGTGDSPTMVEVEWTDTSVTPWRTARYTTPAASPRRLSRLSKPGITRYSEARRYAIERLNEAHLCDLSISFVAFDDALAVQVGDIVTVTHPLGLTDKAFRVAKIDPLPPGGRWQIAGVEYDPAKYCDEVVEFPTTPDTSLTSPNTPPLLASVTAAEQTYALDNGTFASRLAIAWTTPASFPFVRQFIVKVVGGGVTVASALVDGSLRGWTTQALQQGVAYTVSVAIVSTSGAVGADTWVASPVTLIGKGVVPGDVGSVSGFEAGGRVFLRWTRADNPTDPGTPDPDIWRYEVRRGATGDAWAAAQVVDQVDALTLVDEGAPAGTWRYQVKAIDSIDQYSTTAATVDVVVTLDSAAFLVDAYDHTSPTLTGMESFTLAPTDPHAYYITEDGASVASKFTASPLSSGFSGVMAENHASVTSTWLGEPEDFGLLIGGQWTGTASVADVSGSHVSSFGYSTDGGAYTYAAGLSQKANARFARLKHEATTTSTLLVTAPTQRIRVDAIPREEVGTGTSSASGPVTVTLENPYVAVKKLIVTAEGSTARFALADNITVGDPTTFDVYVFNDSGTKLASAFRYAFQGV